MRYTDEQRLEKIFKYSTMLRQYIEEMHVDEQKLLDDYRIQWAITTPLYNIGEYAYALSKEFKEQHDDIPWNIIASLRHRLVHDYEGTNWSIISDVVFQELPVLSEKVKDILQKSDH